MRNSMRMIFRNHFALTHYLLLCSQHVESLIVVIIGSSDGLSHRMFGARRRASPEWIVTGVLSIGLKIEIRCAVNPIKTMYLKKSIHKSMAFAMYQCTHTQLHGGYRHETTNPPITKKPMSLAHIFFNYNCNGTPGWLSGIRMVVDGIGPSLVPGHLQRPWWRRSVGVYEK